MSYVGDPFAPIPADQAPFYFYRKRQQERAARRRALDGLFDDPVPLTPPSLEAVADVNALADAFYLMKRANGQAPGPDGVKYPDIGRRELFEILRHFNKAILTGSYRPGPARQVKIPKGSGTGFRTLTLRNLIDRVVAKALTVASTSYWERIFLDGSHGFRPGRSQLTMVAALERAVVGQGRWVLVSDDIRKAFDSVRLDLVLDHHRAHLVSNGLLTYLVEPVLRGGDPARAVGMDQGCPYMPTALNVHLHHAYDQYAHAPGANPGTPTSWYRYADNLVVACRDVQEGQQVLLHANQRLSTAGLTLKGDNGGQPVDLRRGGSVQILGFILFRQGNKLRYKLGQDAWDGLERSLLKAHEATCPPDTARAVLEGWVASHGPAFSGKTDRTANRLLDLASRLGFRETYPRDYYEEECRRAWLRWRRLVSQDSREGGA
jgi:hypothetical protein